MEYLELARLRMCFTLLRAQTNRYAMILRVYLSRARFSYLPSLAVLTNSSPGTVHAGIGRGEEV